MFLIEIQIYIIKTKSVASDKTHVPGDGLLQLLRSSITQTGIFYD
jgi:hypothetical protein